MRTRTKRVLGVATVASMLLGIAPAVAYADGTITVANVQPADGTSTEMETYTAYKVFDATKDATGDGVTYKIRNTDDWFAVLFDADGNPVSGNAWFTLRPIADEPNTYQVIPADDYTTEAKAKEAADWLYARRGDIAGITLESGENSVADGYYLVQSTLGSNLGLATADFGMEIVEKNIWPSIDKRQNDSGANATYSDGDVSVAVNDYVYYDIVVYVPASADKDITVTDTMSAGLTYDVDTGVTARAGAERDSWSADLGAADFVVNDSPAEGTFAVTIHPTASTLGKYVELRFRAQVDADAIVADTAKANSATLAYSNYTQVDTVQYQTAMTGAQKYDGDTATVGDGNLLVVASDADAITYLGGAEFSLQVKDGNAFADVPVVLVTDAANGDYYRPATSGETGVAIVTSEAANGRFVIRGLDPEKDYQLVETKAPDGYNLLTAPSSLALSPNNLTAEGKAVVAGSDAPETAIVKVANKKGTILPTTGGIGTVILYVVGGGLVAAGAIYFVMKARNGHNEE